MIYGLVLRWVVTGLFLLAAAECLLPVVTQRRSWTSVMSHGLHFVMAVAMAAMAWPWSTRFPTTGLAVFFLLAAVWFVTVGVVSARTTAPRVLYGYHGLMMLATAWMYAIMNVHLLPVGSSIQHHTEPDMSMPDMDMAAMTSMPASSGSPLWLDVVNWLGTVAFAVAAVFWACRHVIQRRQGTTRYRSLGNLGQAMMAAGMATLFLATLFRI